MATIAEILKSKDIKYKESNREKRMRPRKGLFWCGDCDRALVAEHKKCPVCGGRNSHKMSYKKEPPTE